MTYSVEIEVERMDMTGLNLTEIQSVISNITGIEADKLRIRVETKDYNEVIRIIVIVDDEETAEKIRDKINVAIDEHNEEGIVRHFKSARVVVKENKLSISSGSMEEEKRIVAMFAVIFLAFIIHNQ